MWEVIVSNVGTIVPTLDEQEARDSYDAYVELAKASFGRAAGESVTLVHDGEIVMEHAATWEIL